MELCSTFIETDKFDEVVEFYEKLFEVKGSVYTKNRWVEFDVGNKLAIYNELYDKEKIDSGDSLVNYNEAYIKNFKYSKKRKGNDTIILNLYVDNLNSEYERIKNLNLGSVSEIMYVNITEPYYYFNLSDPEGNVLEICGDYFQE